MNGGIDFIADDLKFTSYLGFGDGFSTSRNIVSALGNTPLELQQIISEVPIASNEETAMEVESNEPTEEEPEKEEIKENQIEDGNNEPEKVDDSGENAGLENEPIEAENSKLDEEALNNFEPPAEKIQPWHQNHGYFLC